MQFSRPAEIWTLTGQFPDVPIMRAGRAFEVVARLKPGVTMAAAQTELNVIAERLAVEDPEPNKGPGVTIPYTCSSARRARSPSTFWPARFAAA